jgi:hypothetical protein
MGTMISHDLVFPQPLESSVTYKPRHSLARPFSSIASSPAVQSIHTDPTGGPGRSRRNRLPAFKGPIGAFARRKTLSLSRSFQSPYFSPPDFDPHMPIGEAHAGQRASEDTKPPEYSQNQTPRGEHRLPPQPVPVVVVASGKGCQDSRNAIRPVRSGPMATTSRDRVIPTFVPTPRDAGRTTAHHAARSSRKAPTLRTKTGCLTCCSSPTPAPTEPGPQNVGLTGFAVSV